MASDFWGGKEGMDMGGEERSPEASGEREGLKYRSGRGPLKFALQAFTSICISIPNS